MLHRSAFTRRLIILVLQCLLCVGISSAARAQGQTNDNRQRESWQRELDLWRVAHASELQKPDGWLALVGLEWLEPGDNSFGSAPDNKIHIPGSAPAHLGILRLDGATVTLKSPAPSPYASASALPDGFPAGFMIDGKPAEPMTLATDPDSDKNNPRLTVGSLSMYVIRRADRYGLRIKDSRSALLRNFHGLKWFPANATYRVTARWIPYNPQRSTSLATLIGTHYSQPVPGVAEFKLAGKTFRLEPVIEDPAEAKLFFIIRDTTSTSTTYGACRFLYVDFTGIVLAKPGELVLDFNRLENPPCAYTKYATCPLPPASNRLRTPIPAGEKRYHP
jgi:uncharacterized protein (DUF1684 family)